MAKVLLGLPRLNSMGAPISKNPRKHNLRGFFVITPVHNGCQPTRAYVALLSGLDRSTWRAHSLGVIHPFSTVGVVFGEASGNRHALRAVIARRRRWMACAPRRIASVPATVPGYSTTTNLPTVDPLSTACAAIAPGGLCFPGFGRR